MGNQLTTDTLCSKDSNGHSYWVAVDWKSFRKGGNKKCYLGVLNGFGPRSGEKVVVKAFKDQKGTRGVWAIEKLKAKTANLLLDMYKSQHPIDGEITINAPFLALMDSVSKMNEIFGSRSRSRSLNANEWVGIEQYIAGTFGRFCVTDSLENSLRSEMLEAYSHFSYHQSRGAFVICDFEGVHQKGSYHITNPTIHSQNCEFGTTDLGVYGINEFFKVHRCNDICREMAKMQPLSPPPSFDDICYELSSGRCTPSAPPQEWAD